MSLVFVAMAVNVAVWGNQLNHVFAQMLALML